MKKSLALLALSAASVGIVDRTSWALTLGQIDNFQDGTLENWQGGDVLTNVANGGPAGAGDNYLSMMSTGGGGPASHLATYNPVQWSGNYTAAGITEISADMMNPVATGASLDMRVVLFGPTGGRWTSAVADVIPDDGVWHHELFSLQSSALINVDGSDTLAATLAGATRLMFRHDVTASSGGTAIAATLGIDNILATMVGPPNLTWDNTGGTGDGVTWDTGVNQNWNDGSGPATFSSGSNVTFDDANNGNYAVSIPTIVTPNSVIVNNSAGNYVFSGAGGIGGSGSLTKMGSGTLTLSEPNSYSGGTVISAGVVVANAGTLATGGMSIGGTSALELRGPIGTQAKMSSLSISSTGQLDVGADTVILSYGASDPVSTVAAWLKTGYAGGAWTGPGINSSAAAANPGYAVGYADGASGVVAGISSGQIEFRYTLYGDLNLDGVVNGTDFGLLASNFGQTTTGGWVRGDLNFDGVVNGTDFGLLASNFGKSASGSAVVLPASEWAALDSFAAEHGLLSDVPEPATRGLGLVMGITALCRRRRASALRIR
jgi:autotransporter-associated beta strand protein